MGSKIDAAELQLMKVLETKIDTEIGKFTRKGNKAFVRLSTRSPKVTPIS